MYLAPEMDTGERGCLLVGHDNLQSTLGLFITVFIPRSNTLVSAYLGILSYTPEGYHEYIGDTMMSVGDIMSTLVDSSVHRVAIQIQLFLQMTSPYINHDITCCSDDITPVY